MKENICNLCLFFMFISTYLFSQTIIHPGNVTGTWTESGNPYMITGDIFIPSNDSLLIYEGVEIQIIGNYSLTVNGLIKAKGTPSNSINFKGISGSPGSWKYIYFSETATTGCILDYCIIKDGGGVDSVANVYIQNNSNIIIKNCEITNSSGSGVFIQAKLQFSYVTHQTKTCNPILNYNKIHNNLKNGIYVNAYFNSTGLIGGDKNTCIANPLLEKNVIYNNQAHGIECYTFGDGGTNYGFEMDPTIKTNPYIQRNTIFGNTLNGIKCEKHTQGWWGGTIIIETNPFISSNIIANNLKYGLNVNNLVSIENVKHNDFWNNVSGCLSGINGNLCQNTQINLNGDSCDINLNIKFNPYFVDEGSFDFHLTDSSKCIDAGDITLSFDPDSTFPDIGAFYYHQTPFYKTITVGWNLLGLPYEVSDPYYLSLFPNAIPNTLYSYSGNYYNVSTLEIGKGYWLDFPASEVVQIQGSPFNSVTIDLIQGWNMVSGPSYNILAASINDPDSIIVPGSLYGFDGTYYFSDSIKQGNGYWLRANTAGQVTLASGVQTSPPFAKQFDNLQDISVFPALQISDATGACQTLYFNVRLNDSQSKLSYGLPPLPPAGAFDARFDGDYRICESDEATILIQSSNYPLLINAVNLPAEKDYQYLLKEIASGKEIANHELREGERILINNPNVKTLRLTGDKMVPLKFAVQQNYPNPFNPTTIIRYTIPRSAKVEIVIYNTLGQKVKTLLSQFQKAGHYSVIWNAKNDVGEKVGSGIYYYTIKAGKHSMVRKMLLLK